jgi:4-hydroxy-tetrahydrodipicolinate synthase
MLERFGARGFDVFVGSESFLLANMRGGGVGCISATANVNPGPIDRLFREWQSPRAEELQAALDVTRAIFQKHPMIAALKCAIARWSGDPQWTRVRPPLVELDTSASDTLVTALEANGFDMPNLRAGQPAT